VWEEWYYGSYYTSSYSDTYDFGRVIEVDESAVDAHIAHGDGLYYNALDAYYTTGVTYADLFTDLDSYFYDYSWDYGGYWYGHVDYTNTNGVIKNANCWFWSG
jgi:hypothetical protein